jgi:hypothetical protein
MYEHIDATNKSKSESPERGVLDRCHFRHPDFRRRAWHHSTGDEECWVRDTAEFPRGRFCIFHAPNEEPIGKDSGRWPIHVRQQMQTNTLVELLADWNNENQTRAARGRRPIPFVLPAIDCGALSILDDKLLGTLLLRHSRFHGFVDLSFKVFEQELDVSFSEFKAGGIFDHADFFNLRADRCEFHETATFLETRFRNHVYFRGTDFKKSVSFGGAGFCRHGLFKESVFHGGASFSDLAAISITFDGVVFYRFVDLQRLECETALVRNCDFRAGFSMRGEVQLLDLSSKKNKRGQIPSSRSSLGIAREASNGLPEVTTP